MDANGQRFWLLGDAGDWPGRNHVRWDEACGALCLASERSLPAPVDPAASHAAANTALERVPRSVDGLGCVARWDALAGAAVVRSGLPDEAVLLMLPSVPSDLAIGHDGILYLAVDGGVRLHDLRGRWEDVTVSAAGFSAWRLAADPAGGVWALERASGRLAHVRGRPLPLGGPVGFSGTTFRPDPENCCPPRIEPMPVPQWPADERPLALACDPQGRPWLLAWSGGDGVARLRAWDVAAQCLDRGHELQGARYAYALAFADARRVVVRIPFRNDAPAFDLPRQEDADVAGIAPCGDVYPLATAHEEAPFAHRIDGPPQYPVAVADGVRGVEPLHRLSWNQLARHGEARNFDGAQLRLLDSGDPQTVWHRLHAEARLPARTGFVAWCAATDEAQPPAADDPDAWSPHVFGDVAFDEPHAARAVWEHAPSELPHHPGLGRWPREPGRAGLFSVLLQDPRRRVRRVQGRYLWLRVELSGDGRNGPEIAALRAWSSRFSYRDRYLPRLYREDQHGAPAALPGQRVLELSVRHLAALDAGGAPPPSLLEPLRAGGVDAGGTALIRVEEDGHRWQLQDGGRGWRLRREANTIAVYRAQATPADFLERLLCNFEGVLTPLEDRIAQAHLLTDPAVVPEPQLDWLGAWVGIAFDPALPAPRRRDWLAAAPRLARLHGTLPGLQLALDIATGGGVSGGEIVVVEEFRLRRLMATLLGVDLAEADDPLLPGLIVSGNSVVGDTLVLGDAERAELYALFRGDVASAAENLAVAAFDERFAHRAAVLVHGVADGIDFGLLERIVELEAPAHVQVRIEAASWPFLVGVASLVGVDTWLAAPKSPRPARVQVSSLGNGDFVLGPVALDPRLAGAAAPAPQDLAPIADAGPDLAVAAGESFELDGSGSSAAPGRRLTRYVWRQLEPDR